MIGKMIEEYRYKRFMTQVVLAEKTGISRRTIQLYEKEENNPSADNLSKIAQVLDVTVGTLTGDDEGLANVPVYSSPDSPEILRFEQVPFTWTEVSKCYGLVVPDFSMAPRILMGDTIIVREQPLFEQGDIVVFKNGEDTRFTMGQVVEIPKGFLLRPFHQGFQTVYYGRDEIDMSLKIIGKVMEMRAKL